jgi:hypothetical protein
MPDQNNNCIDCSNSAKKFKKNSEKKFKIKNILKKTRTAPKTAKSQQSNDHAMEWLNRWKNDFSLPKGLNKQESTFAITSFGSNPFLKKFDKEPIGKNCLLEVKTVLDLSLPNRKRLTTNERTLDTARSVDALVNGVSPTTSDTSRSVYSCDSSNSNKSMLSGNSMQMNLGKKP